ncbi:hypothetical protein BDN72DRAFT_905623 [Pluteus cervinus]|uniref:Uncharacterized protein n=1 Tax=Pluteus cervinus TaxID=181527 RepID=A0ACD3A1Y8_9AGAR|nr:hypothetical protein BDN72DRAFT_905623 [Pluteus cervinus]
MKRPINLSLTLSQARSLAALLESSGLHEELYEEDGYEHAGLSTIFTELLIRLSIYEQDDELDHAMDGEPYECLPPTPAILQPLSACADWHVPAPTHSYNDAFSLADGRPPLMNIDSPKCADSSYDLGSPMTLSTPEAQRVLSNEQDSSLTYAVFGGESPCTPIASRSPSLSPTLSRRTTSLSFQSFQPMALPAAGLRRVFTQLSRSARAGGGGGGGGAGTGGTAINWDPTCRRGAQTIVADVIQQINQYPDQIGLVDPQQQPYQLVDHGRQEHDGYAEGNSDDAHNAAFEGQQTQQEQHVQVWDKAAQLPPSNIILSATTRIIPVAERQALSQLAKTLITRIAIHFDKVTLGDLSLFNPHEVMDFFDHIFSDRRHLSSHNELQGLAKVAHDCYGIEQMGNVLRFMYMMKIITFRIGVHNEAAHNGQARKSVLRQLRKNGDDVLSSLSIGTLERYVVEGSKVCLLLGAGSIYFVGMFAWVATKAELSDLTSTDAIRLAALIRCPDDSTHGKLVRESIIPGIDYLRRRYPFSLPSLYTELNRWRFDCPEMIDCSNIFTTDTLMDSLDYDSFVKGRDWEVWEQCLTPLSSHNLLLTQQPAPLPIASPPPLPLLPMPVSPPRYPVTSTLAFSIPRPLALLPPQPSTSPPPIPPLPLNSPPPLPPQPLISPPPLPPRLLTSPPRLLTSPPLPPQPFASPPPLPLSSPPLQPPFPPPPPPSLPTTELFLIETNFDPNHGVNKNITFPRGDNMSQTKQRQDWTQNERDKVNQYKVVAITGEELKAKIIKQLKHGYKQYHDPQGELVEDQNDKAYIYAPNDVLRQSKVVRFNGRHKKVIAIVCTGLHNQIKSRLLRPLEAVFGDQLKRHNSFITPFDPFYSLHFSFYNRYSVKAPKNTEKQNFNVDPCTIQKKDKKKKANTAQFIPRASGEIRDHPAKYGAMQQMMAPVFTFIDKLVEKHLPEDHKDLKEFVEALPGNAVSPASPFSGFVINLNAVTQAHRDWNDQSICVVTVISDPDCEGGELVLVEPGLVLDLKCGDMVIFPSSQLSHFNLHFKGIRASVVCHSDKYATSWLADRNGWQYYPLFKSQRGRKAGTKGVGKASAKQSSAI